MRPGQHITLGHWRQLVVNFWLIKLLLQVLSKLIKLPEETPDLVEKNVTYNAGRGGQWPSTVPALQGSSLNVILYPLIIQSPPESYLCVHAMLLKKFPRKPTRGKYGDIGNWRKDKLTRGSLNKPVNSYP